MGTHTWPETNTSTLTIVEDKQVDTFLESVKKLNALNEEVGISAFVWQIQMTV